jgi:hypothetical protein
MTLTKANARTLIQHYLDDTGGVRWSSSGSPSPLDLALGLIYDDLWGELLEIAPFMRSITDTITSSDIDSTKGTIDLSEAGALLTQRLFRIQEVLRDGRPFGQLDPKDALWDDADSALVSTTDYRWWLKEEELWLSPVDTSTTVYIKYAPFPAAFTGLAETAAIDWPSGHEQAFILKAAATLMAKGNMEENGMLFGLGERAWKRTLSHVKRYGIGPLSLRAGSGRRQDWGDID